MITNIDQILRKRGKGWEIVAENWILREFFRGHDYVFWRDDTIEETCGGNAIWWTFVDDEVHLQFQLDDPDDPANMCKVKKDVLWDAIRKKQGNNE
jgi:hypothetical protein